jgi:hypothetical protein
MADGEAKKNWWEENWTEELTIAAVAILSVVAMVVMPESDVPQTVAAGLVGYVAKSKSSS